MHTKFVWNIFAELFKIYKISCGICVLLSVLVIFGPGSFLITLPETCRNLTMQKTWFFCLKTILGSSFIGVKLQQATTLVKLIRVCRPCRSSCHISDLCRLVLVKLTCFWPLVKLTCFWPVSINVGELDTFLTSCRVLVGRVDTTPHELFHLRLVFTLCIPSLHPQSPN